MNPVMQITVAFLGSLGFGLFFNIKMNKLLKSSLNGAIAWSVFLIVSRFSVSTFLPYFVSSSIAAAISEYCAKKNKTPSIVYYIPGIVPLVPGSTLYYMMESIIGSNYNEAQKFAITLLWAIVGIGTGCAFVVSITRFISKIKMS